MDAYIKCTETLTLPAQVLPGDTSIHREGSAALGKLEPVTKSNQNQGWMHGNSCITSKGDFETVNLKGLQ